MEIEIVTTKKKLSKSIINQMSIASVDTVMHGIKLGYVSNIRKEMARALLISHGGNHFVFPMNWVHHHKSLTRRIGKGSQEKKFETAEECRKFWEAYQEILKNVQQIYI